MKVKIFSGILVLKNIISKKMYKVFDSLGNLMRKFSTYQAAVIYKMVYGNYGWTIK